MDRLGTRRVGAGKGGGHIGELDARSSRIGVGMDDPDEIGAIGLIQLAGNLDRDPLAGTRREPVDITDQRDHDPNRRLLHFCIQRPSSHTYRKKIVQAASF